MRIAIGADHAGFPLKEHLVATLVRLGHEVDDRGTFSRGAGRLSADLRRRRARRWSPARADRGIVIGGSGQGEQMAANKVRGVRAALCNDLYTARMSREHNDANVLAMGGRIVAFGLADEIVALWLEHRRSRAAATSAASIRSPTSNGAAGVGERRAAATAALYNDRHEDEPFPLAHAGRDRSGDRRRDRPRAAPPEHRPRADRVGELRQPGGAGGGRLGDDQQVRRGLPGQALLRRLRVRRRRRVAGDRARQAAVRRRARQRAAALGRAGQHGGVLLAAASRATPSSA